MSSNAPTVGGIVSKTTIATTLFVAAPSRIVFYPAMAAGDRSAFRVEKNCVGKCLTPRRAPCWTPTKTTTTRRGTKGATGLIIVSVGTMLTKTGNIEISKSQRFFLVRCVPAHPFKKHPLSKTERRKEQHTSSSHNISHTIV